MPSCKIGHVYIVFASVSNPPKAKFALCICDQDELFIWFNTLPRPHGRDQLAVSSGCHELIIHDSYLDLSRLVKHSTVEIEEGKEFACIDKTLRDAVVSFIDQGLDVMPGRHAQLIHVNLSALPL